MPGTAIRTVASKDRPIRLETKVRHRVGLSHRFNKDFR